MNARELVVVLHGLGNSKWIMAPLALFLRMKGFKTLNISYPSLSAGIQDLAEWIAEKIETEVRTNSYDSVHLVGFSLGSQIGRVLLNKLQGESRFRRIVMLGPPNKGSRFARWLSSWLPSAKIWGPVFQELCQHDLPNPCPECEVGIIAGGLGLKSGFNPFMGADNDGLVALSETFLEGAKEHKTIIALHVIMPLTPRVIWYSYRFLRDGQF